MKSYVFGMAKSSLNLVGAKRQKLELDYLRLAHACQHYQRLGHQVRGFLAVTTTAIKIQAEPWATTYKVPAGMIEIVPVALTPAETSQLQYYQQLNRQAMTGTLDKGTTTRHADASFGRKLMEQKLRDYVKLLPDYADVLFPPDVKDPEMSICWDLFAEI